MPFVTVMTGGYSNMYGGKSFAGGLAVQKNGLWLSQLLNWRDDHNSIGVVLVAGAVAFVWCWLTQGEAMPRKEKKNRVVGIAAGNAGLLDEHQHLPVGMAGRTAGGGKVPAGGSVPVAVFLTGHPAAGSGQCLCRVGAAAGTVCPAPVAVLLLSASLLGVGIFYHSYLPTVDTAYLGDSAQMIYADNKVSNQAWYYDSLYLPDGAVETRDGFVCNTVVTTVEISSVTRRNGVTVVNCKESTGQTGHAELPLLYYPGYTILNTDGQVFRTSNGMVGITVPAGYSGEIQVAFREPKRWLAADLVSLATLLALAAGFAVCKRKKRV